MEIRPNVMRLIKLNLSNFKIDDQLAFCPDCDWQMTEPYAMNSTCPVCEEKLHITKVTEDLLSLMETDNGWRPIYTAPTDGTKVVIGWFLVRGEDNQAYAFYHPTLSVWSDGRTIFSQSPTHWRPRPLAPEPRYNI